MEAAYKPIDGLPYLGHLDGGLRNAAGADADLATIGQAIEGAAVSVALTWKAEKDTVVELVSGRRDLSEEGRAKQVSRQLEKVAEVMRARVRAEVELPVKRVAEVAENIRRDLAPPTEAPTDPAQATRHGEVRAWFTSLRGTDRTEALSRAASDPEACCALLSAPKAMAVLTDSETEYLARSFSARKDPARYSRLELLDRAVALGRASLATLQEFIR